MRSAVVSGRYAARGNDGIHDLIDIETVRAVADTAAELRDSLDNGGGISGPAAKEAINIAARKPVFAGTAITATTARRLIANGDLIVYDNPQALLLCRYKPDRALCQRGRPTDAPRLGGATLAVETWRAPIGTLHNYAPAPTFSPTRSPEPATYR